MEEESKKRRCAVAAAGRSQSSLHSHALLISPSFTRALSFHSGVRFVINMSTASLQGMSVVVGQGLGREWEPGRARRREGRRRSEGRKSGQPASNVLKAGWWWWPSASLPPSRESRESRLELPDQMRRADLYGSCCCSLPKTELRRSGNKEAICTTVSKVAVFWWG